MVFSAVQTASFTSRHFCGTHNRHTLDTSVVTIVAAMQSVTSRPHLQQQLAIPTQYCPALTCIPFRHHQQSSSRRRAAARLAAFKLTGGGQERSIDKARYIIGSGAEADLQLKGPQVAQQHAELKQKGKQVFLKALQGESVFDRTYTWIDEQEVRANVSYVLASGSTVAFGEQQQSFTVEFEEPSGSNPLVEMMMQGMAASADPAVKKELE